jgi:hypothetical protein
MLLMRADVTYVAATTRTDTIGRWDVITLEHQQESLEKTIEEQLDAWILETPINHDPPETFPPAGIQSKSARKKDNESSVGGVSYLSSSAGSYDSVVEDYNDQASYHAPPSSGVISGLSWAQAALKNIKTPSTAGSQPTASNILELTLPTTTIQNKRYDEMERRVSEELSTIRSKMGELTEMRNLMMRIMAKMERKEDERMEARNKKAEDSEHTDIIQGSGTKRYAIPTTSEATRSTRTHGARSKLCVSIPTLASKRIQHKLPTQSSLAGIQLRNHVQRLPIRTIYATTPRKFATVATAPVVHASNGNQQTNGSTTIATNGIQ